MTYSPETLRWAREEADRPFATAGYQGALAWFGRVFDKRGAAAIHARLADAEICNLADARADLMRREVEAITEPMTTHGAADWLRSRVADLGARPFAWPGCDDTPALQPPADVLAGMFERAQCAQWWRRQLRRAVVVARETEAMQAGEVCARRHQVYVTDDTVERRRARMLATAAMLAATEIEDAAGEVITLAEAAEASTSNPAIRRGELMTRIRGAEEWAERAGMVGLFTTNTTPSRFHPQTMHGGANPKHDGSTPRDGQGWLRLTWARTRANLDRAGVRWFGFRVAEPHHDGCPHWHMLLWVDPVQSERMQAIIRAHWLADAGDEPGAAVHRFKSRSMEHGGAAGYVAKYIAKNIDDAGAVELEGHRDEDHEGQTDWVGTGKAQRVVAWASAWGIRQFQSLGQPPVTVWRELRRITAEGVRGAVAQVQQAHSAVHRDGERRACWRAYMDAQGGAMTGRRYGIRIVRRDEPTTGRYGDIMPGRIIGIEHTSRPGEWVLSDRREWRARGAWTDAERRPAPLLSGEGLRRVLVFPRTRFNNCTAPASRAGGAAYLMNAGIVGAARSEQNRGAGGGHTMERATWKCGPPFKSTTPTTCATARPEPSLPS